MQKKYIRLFIGGSVLLSLGLIMYALNSEYATLLMAIGFTMEMVAAVLFAYTKINNK